MKRLLLCVALLAVPSVAQEVASAEADNLFYRAFFLYRGERRYDAALEAYKKFLAMAPDHAYADRAARDVVTILNRSGRAEEAAAFRSKRPVTTDTKAETKADAKPESEPPAARAEGDQAGRRGDRRRRAAGGAGDARTAPAAMTDADRKAAQAELAELQKSAAAAKESGDERGVRRLERQVARLEARLRGEQPAGRPGRGAEAGAGDAAGGRRRGAAGGARAGRGGMRGLDFTKMSDDEIKASVERMERFVPMMVERTRERGDEKRADAMQAGWTKIKALLEEGKTDEAQKVWGEVMGGFGRGRG